MSTNGSIHPRTILITGSSSGFGLALVRHFLSQPSSTSQQWNVIATSRNPSKNPELVKEVKEHPSGRGRWIRLDVCDPQSEIDKVLREADGLFNNAGVDVVVNNAGYSILGVTETVDEEEARKMMDANFWGTLKVCKAAIPLLRNRNRSRGSSWIVNFSSIAGLNANANCGIYAASKFAVEGLTESLAQELSPFAISTLLIEPGMFATSFFATHSGTSTLIAPLPPHYTSTPVATSHALFSDASTGKVPLRGDPDKAAGRIREVLEGRIVLDGLKGEGTVKRLLLGEDAYGRAEAKLVGMLEEVRRQEGWAGGLDRDGFVPVGK